MYVVVLDVVMHYHDETAAQAASIVLYCTLTWAAN